MEILIFDPHLNANLTAREAFQAFRMRIHVPESTFEKLDLRPGQVRFSESDPKCFEIPVAVDDFGRACEAADKLEGVLLRQYSRADRTAAVGRRGSICSLEG